MEYYNMALVLTLLGPKHPRSSESSDQHRLLIVFTERSEHIVHIPHATSSSNVSSSKHFMCVHCYGIIYIRSRSARLPSSRHGIALTHERNLPYSVFLIFRLILIFGCGALLAAARASAPRRPAGRGAMNVFSERSEDPFLRVHECLD